jgi:hypothetical protein
MEDAFARDVAIAPKSGLVCTRHCELFIPRNAEPERQCEMKEGGEKEGKRKEKTPSCSSKLNKHLRNSSNGSVERIIAT